MAKLMDKKELEFQKGCEAICFECGSSNDLTVIGTGVALCPKCLSEEETDGN